MKNAILLSAMLLFCGKAWAQGQWIDSILPPDHLLEVLPWLEEDGTVTSKGLFDFEDLRGAPQKDLILIYRPSVPVQELDKPHNQTFVVCFYDPDKKEYMKKFVDDGGEVQWVRLAKGPSSKEQVLVFLRNDLNGKQTLKAYTFFQGTPKQVLEASAAKIFAKFSDGAILCSEASRPRSEAEAQKVFAWDQGKALFIEKRSTAAKGWTGQTIISAGKPTKEPGGIEIQTPVVVPAENGPLAAFQEFKGEIPQLIQKGQIAVVGQKAKAFFDKLQKDGVGGKEYSSMRSTYYATVAGAVLEGGDSKGAAFYLKTALQLQQDNPEALAVQEKLKPEN